MKPAGMRLRLISIALISIATVSICVADVVLLKDGTRLEGDVKKTAKGWTVTTSDGATIELSADKVKSIELGQSPNGKSPTDQATSSLLSLRRAVENVSDIKQIIDRYHRFLDQYKDTPSAAEAQQDLATWQDRAERGLVKLGNKWITAQERTALADQALAVAAQAQDLVAHGRLKDADALLQQALDLDPQCVPALYLKGVQLFQQRQLPNARKQFETVLTLINDHGPTLNNVAVILWMQRAAMPALAKFDQAMTAAPVNKTVLDNVAEALNVLTDEQRKNRVAQGVYRRFVEQDASLQQTMAAQGFYRWGGTWVDKATMEGFKQKEKDVNEKIAAAQAEQTAAEKQMLAIDSQIELIERSLRQIESDSISRDTNGKIIRLPYPPIYYDLQNQEVKLKNDRVAEQNKAATAKAKVKSLQQDLPKPKFTGVQLIVGAEGTPVMIKPGDPPGAPSPTPAAAQQPATLEPTPAPAPPPENPAATIPMPAWPATAPSTAPTSSPSTQP